MTVRDLSGSMLKFKKDYRHIADRAEDCDLLADFHNLVGGSIYFCHLLNIRRTEYIALLRESNFLRFELI